MKTRTKPLRTPPFAAIALVLTFAGAGTVGPGPAAPGAEGPYQDDTTGPPADHHVHIWSQDARDFLVRSQEELGQEVIAEAQARPLTSADVIADLDSAGIRRAVLLSTAYFFGIPDLDVEHEYSKVRAENDYVARQVQAHPDRLVGFFSVNPTADYALEEIDRLAGHPAFVGLKLQLGNSDVDLLDEGDAALLRKAFARANEHGLAVVVHLGGRSEEFGRPDAEAFLDEVLPAAPDVPVQVAHMGGPGGFGPGTRASIRAFAAALNDHPERTRNLVFELSAVPHPTYLASGDTALERRIEDLNRAFVEVAREIGFDRIVYGTDYPLVSMPRYLEGLRSSLPLTEEEFRDLVDDPAPYLR
jgi:predicted TIM-barrel fold metal-dependent hydrolase